MIEMTKDLHAFGGYLRHLWRGTDTLAIYPRIGLSTGLALVALLVPGLNIWNGVNGPLSQSIPLFFLVPVLVASSVGGRWPGVIVACVALVAWDWFFIKPLYTITIASARDVTALIVFLVVAILVGQLSVVARRRTQEAIRRAKSSEALYELSTALIAGSSTRFCLPLPNGCAIPSTWRHALSSCPSKGARPGAPWRLRAVCHVISALRIIAAWSRPPRTSSPMARSRSWATSGVVPVTPNGWRGHDPARSARAFFLCR